MLTVALLFGYHNPCFRLPNPLSSSAGLTPVDVAINNKQVAIVRRLEQGAAFAGWLSQKVTKYVSG